MNYTKQLLQVQKLQKHVQILQNSTKQMKKILDNLYQKVEPDYYESAYCDTMVNVKLVQNLLNEIDSYLEDTTDNLIDGIYYESLRKNK